MRYLLIILSLFLFISLSTAEAQQRGITYESLLQRVDQPNAYITPILIPISDEESKMGVAFRLDYDFLPFTRIRSGVQRPFEDAQFSARVQMGLDVYTGSYRETRRDGRTTRGSSVFRETFVDTVFVATFEETQSRDQHMQGVISRTISPGDYHYELRLTRGESLREIPSRIQNIKVKKYSEIDSAAVVLASEIDLDDDNMTSTVLNYGRYVLYGQDYHVLYALPKNAGNEFTLQVHRLESGSRTAASSEPVYSASLTSDDLFHGKNPTLYKEDKSIKFSLEKSDGGEKKYLTAMVPNSGFENARYRLTLKNSDDREISRIVVSSQWIDMPVSLYNLDVAINKLRFIVDSDKLQRMKSGSRSEKERRFREFWEERDPSPETEFNELMAEYYHRIDYAYENFTTMQNPGFDTDQGRAYILYGEPERIERRLLTDRPTREIWEYPNRTLIFEATTGFGDFRLISEQ